jgi:hypothetical protein
MEPEGSLPHSQVSATCLYPEPAQSSPYCHIPLPEDLSYYYPPIYAWVSSVVSFPQVFTPKPCTHLSPPTIRATYYYCYYYYSTETMDSRNQHRVQPSKTYFLTLRVKLDACHVKPKLLWFWWWTVQATSQSKRPFGGSGKVTKI